MLQLKKKNIIREKNKYGHVVRAEKKIENN